MNNLMVPTPKLNGSARKRTNEDEELYTVYLTTDYNKFKIMPDNRNINLAHVKRLAMSFKQRHLVSPIIVNERMEVIDGQHRLRAAKETGKPVHYILIPGYGIDEVQVLNTNQKNWLKIDYLHSYCSEGRKEYLEFKEFMDRFPDFGIQVCERILTGVSKSKSAVIEGSRTRMKDFEEGKLNIPSLSTAYSIARKVMDYKEFFQEFNRGTFVSALIAVFKSKNYDHKEMLHKLTVAPIKLQLCPNVESYKLLLETIYNHKRNKENKVSFRYV